MEPLGFELGQASCFDQELFPVRAGRRECRDKLGLVTVLRMPWLLQRTGATGNKSQFLRGAEWAHNGALGGVWWEEQRAPATRLKVESQISSLWLLETCSSNCGLGLGLGFTSFGRGESYKMWIWVQVTILLPWAIPGVQI